MKMTTNHRISSWSPLCGRRRKHLYTILSVCRFTAPTVTPTPAAWTLGASENPSLTLYPSILTTSSTSGNRSNLVSGTRVGNNALTTCVDQILRTVKLSSTHQSTLLVCTTEETRLLTPPHNACLCPLENSTPIRHSKQFGTLQDFGLD